MATIIPIKDNPNHSIIQSIDSVIYQFVFKYNSKFDFWTMDILTEDGSAILYGIKIVANYPLIFSHKNSLLPDGDFMAQTSDKNYRIGRDSFSTGKAQLIYLTSDELKAI